MSCYTRIGASYPIFGALYSLIALTSASEALDGDHLEEEVRGGRRARASAERDEPMASADTPQLRPRSRFLPSSRKGEGARLRAWLAPSALWRGFGRGLAHHQVADSVHVHFSVKRLPRPPYKRLGILIATRTDTSRVSRWMNLFEPYSHCSRVASDNSLPCRFIR